MTTDIRKLLAQERRVETGPIQFGEDWPGVFIRGDNAAYYALVVGETLHELSGQGDDLELLLVREAMGGLQRLLASAVVREAPRGEGNKISHDDRRIP